MPNLARKRTGSLILMQRTLLKRLARKTFRSPDKSLKVNVLTAIVAGILAFVGSCLGIVLTGVLEQQHWEQQTSYEQRIAVFNKKVDLIERTVRVLNQMKHARSSQAEIDTKLNLLSLLLYKQDFSEAMHKTFREVYESSRNVADYSAELASVLSLDAIFFGPKTGAVIQSFMDSGIPLSQIDPASSQNLVNAMAEELGYLPDK